MDKFLVYNGTILMGNVSCHRDLLPQWFDKDLVAGGGCFEYSEDKEKLYLFDKSYDFGACSLEIIQDAIRSAKFKSIKEIIFERYGTKYHIDTIGNVIEKE
jgi:hypothetical protein